MIFPFFNFVEDSYNVRFDLPSKLPYSVFLLEDSAFKYITSYGEVKNKFTLTFKKPQSKHKIDYWVNRAMLNLNIHTSYFSHAVNYSHEYVTFWYG